MPCDFCVMRARFLSFFGFTSQQYTKFSYFFSVCPPGPAGPAGGPNEGPKNA
jgi:hypothetical protein